MTTGNTRPAMPNEIAYFGRIDQAVREAKRANGSAHPERRAEAPASDAGRLRAVTLLELLNAI
jgi:hypothetical protein